MSESSTTRLILVRHGETLANRELRYIGAGTNNVLSDQGTIQSEALAETLASLPIVALYSSPLTRTLQTAAPIAARHSCEVQVEPDLRELQFGDWEGLSRAEIVARSAQDEHYLLSWETDPSAAPPNGESIAMVAARVVPVLERLVQQHPGQTIVLVSHVMPIKVALCHALAAPLTSIFHLFLDPATISVIDWHASHTRVVLMNGHTHLGWQQARWMRK